MTKIYFPFSSGSGTAVTETYWSRMARRWLKSGVVDFLDRLEVYGDSTGMQVKIRSGAAWIHGHYFESDATETLPIASSDPLLNRIDLVALRLSYTDHAIDFQVLTGTPGTSPTPPSLTQTDAIWEIPLAQVYVQAGSITITANDVTDLRNYCMPRKTIIMQWLPPTGTITSGDSKQVWVVPREYQSWVITRVQAHAITPSSSGNLVFQIHRVRGGNNIDILSAPIIVEANENDSLSATNQPVINPSYQTLAAGDEYHVDVDSAGTGAKGPTVMLVIAPPEE
ncbi:MAG: hypothetical protein ABWK53_10490 [Anaerolineales bacterium]